MRCQGELAFGPRPKYNEDPADQAGPLGYSINQPWRRFTLLCKYYIGNIVINILEGGGDEDRFEMGKTDSPKGRVAAESDLLLPWR